ncbi:4-hydroxy-tetrahydrodipicolinate reductase [Candidatus Curculioniphilus buchneri]|uniref:4-hydroxy-tetrahydrodipicolinate reductase n=1 Tax=Candidatus Curculioniphilus buchneri TaxID=690594 RepID=UPI00376F3E7F
MFHKQPIRIAISGAGGRMWRPFMKVVTQSDKVMLCAALTYPGSKICGMDAGEIAGIGSLGIIVKENLEIVKNDFDILIDFTHPEASLSYLKWCRKHNVNIIIGTTGFNEMQKLEINAAAHEIGIVFSSNFSIGINLMLKLLEKSAKVVGQNADIEIIEAHHHNKVDAPSGTALTMGETISKTLGYSLSDCAIYGHEKYINQRKVTKPIGFSTIRAGSIVGEHTVIFANIDERLEITHKACSRMAFANGAIHAAVWLSSKKKNGLFNMIHVLNLEQL